VDRRGDGQWDGGSPAPFRPAAPMRWVTQVVSVRPRWETALPQPISFADPPDVPAEQPDEPTEIGIDTEIDDPAELFPDDTGEP
jgi:hypothetical protein